MAELHTPIIQRVYSATTDQERKSAYDDWAEQYDADLANMGFRLPSVAAAVFARFVEPGDGPILDAGCGTGLQTEPLHLTGYGPFTGIDLSAGMLEVARRKNIYAELRQMAMGAPLDFEDQSFASAISMGAITPGHAPANSFDELIRVTRAGGLIVFSQRTDNGQDPAYPNAVAAHEQSGAWRKVYVSAPFVTMPVGEPDVVTSVFVYRKI